MPNSQLTNAKYTLGLFSVQKIRVKLRSPRNSSPNKIAPYEACIQINNTVDNFKPSAQLYGIVSDFFLKIQYSLIGIVNIHLLKDIKYYLKFRNRGSIKIVRKTSTV